MKKGFTLIELLAVIVILAIIALVATPIVIDIINDTKLGSVKASMNNIEKAVELYYSSNIKDENIILECNRGICKDNNGKKLEVKGSLPDSGKINISKSGKITYESIVIEGYLCDKYNNEFVCTNKKGNLVESNGESIIIQDNKNTLLSNYKIYGNSVVENSNINSVGNETSNLADLSKIVVPPTTSHVTYNYDNATGTLELTSKPTAYDYALLYLERDLGIEFEYGKTYYYGADVTVSEKDTSNSTEIYFGVVSDQTSANIYYFYENETRHLTGSFIYTGQTDICLVMNLNYGSKEPAQVKFENIYFSEKNEYEPYEPYEKYITSIKINSKSNNLLDFNDKVEQVINGVTWTCENGSIKVKGTSNASSQTKGRLFLNMTGLIGNYYISGSENGVYVFVSVLKDGVTKYYSNSSFVLDGTETSVSIFLKVNSDQTVDHTIYPMLNKGTTKLEYEPYIGTIKTNIYLEEPLRKIENYVDYVDYNNKKLIRNVGVIKLTGEEEWNINNDYFTLKLDKYPKNDKELSISNKLESGKSFWFEKDQLNIKIEGINNLEELKTWLKNNEVEINYPLNKSIVSEIELPEINIHSNYSNILVDTEVAPSKILLEYN